VARNDWRVTELGDLLVLLHGARARVSTVRAVVRTWHHVRVRDEAIARLVKRGDVVTYAPTEVPERDSAESLVRVWFAPPDRVREQREDPDGARLAVRRGRLWWRYDAHNGAMSNEDQPEVGGGIGEEFGWLLDPAAVIGLLDFGPISPGLRAGRRVLRVRAVPRVSAHGSDEPLWRLGAIGADELGLEVDADRGTLLRVESRFEQQPFAVSEVVEISFDEQFPDDTFVFTPPPGEDVRSIAEEFGVRRDLTIEQAVALAPFVVWIPARVPAGWETQIAFAAAQDRPPAAPHVFLHYRAPDGTHALSITESPADHPREIEAEGPGGLWREIKRDHRQIHVREPAETWQPAQARADLDRTRILISSTDLGAEALADLAAGLVRAPSEPPTLEA
jgi:hypothetical protein